MKSVLGRIFLRLARLLGIPEIQKRLDVAELQLLESTDPFRDQKIAALERHLERRFEQSMTDYLATVNHHLTTINEHIGEMQRRIDEIQQTGMRHTEQVTTEIRQYLEKEINTTKRDLDNLRRMSSTSTIGTGPTVAFASPNLPIIDDALYISLEDHFRGEKSAVHLRQTEYVPFIKDVVSEQYPLLDLGCGRGEWLAVLKENGLFARGIDSNQACVAECRENGLSVSSGDLVETLRNLPDSSCGAITMFQVLEHLPFDVVVTVLREARRALINGGVFIGEIPNSETLRVGASTFWIDPTHQKPLFPGVLAFIASTVGFSGVVGKYSSPLAEAPDLSDLPENAAKAILDLHHAINGPGDFALIATA